MKNILILDWLFLSTLGVLHSEIFGGNRQDVDVSLVISKEYTVLVDCPWVGYAHHTLWGVVKGFDCKNMLLENKDENKTEDMFLFVLCSILLLLTPLIRYFSNTVVPLMLY